MQNQSLEFNFIVFRLTAFWAFSECVLGGLLHSVKFPFSGLFLTGISVLCILFILIESGGRSSQLLSSLFLVLLLKIILSPQASPTALMAVGFQASFTFIIFSLIRNLVAVASISMLCCFIESAFQKLILLYLFGGNNLIQAIDEFVLKIPKYFDLFGTIQGSSVLVAFYLLVYIFSSVVFIHYFFRIYKRWTSVKSDLLVLDELNIVESVGGESKKERSYKLKWILLIVGLVLFALPQMRQFFPVWLFRFYLFIIIWMWIVIPIFNFIIKRRMANVSSRNSELIARTLALFPFFKNVFTFLWRKNESYKLFTRFLITLEMSFIYSVLKPDYVHIHPARTY
ncbi:MAG TPA: hypothetical protein PK006_11820 [Saprospiraceae bacterium]|nr:hypothetical protein [Saprospiraceae bacterium]